MGMKNAILDEAKEKQMFNKLTPNLSVKVSWKKNLCKI